MQKHGIPCKSMGIQTRLPDYGIDASEIGILVGQLRAHGMVELGERKDVTPEVGQRILEASL